MHLLVFFLLIVVLALLVPVFVIQLIRGLWLRLTAPFRGYADPYRQHRANQRSHDTPRAKKKIFRRDEGEYVEFEELSSSAARHHDDRQPDSHFSTEEQVSDAEWVDIK